MKFSFLTLNHGRHQIFRLFCASIKRLRSQTGIDFPVVCVGDEEDADICREYDIIHLIHRNVATERWNLGCEYIKTMGVDYVVISGGDDIFSLPALSNLINKMYSEIDLIGFSGIYLYDTDGFNRSQLIHITSKGILGVGRTIHRRVLEAVNWRPWDYPVQRNHGTDAICYKNISPYVKTSAIVDGMIVDCKSKESLNKFTAFKMKGVSTPKSKFYDILSKEELDILSSIKFTGVPIQFNKVYKKGRTLI